MHKCYVADECFVIFTATNGEDYHNKWHINFWTTITNTAVPKCAFNQGYGGFLHLLQSHLAFSPSENSKQLASFSSHPFYLQNSPVKQARQEGMTSPMLPAGFHGKSPHSDPTVVFKKSLLACFLGSKGPTISL